MPTNEPTPILLAQWRRRRTLEEQRAERIQRVQDARQRLARLTAEGRVLATLGDLLGAARRHRDHRASQNHYEETQARLREENLELERGGLLSSIGAVLVGVVKWPAILTIDFLLLAAVSHLLISLVYVRPEGPPWWALLLIPLAVFAFEVVVAAHIALADREARGGNRSARGVVWGWRLLGGILAVVVPAIGTAALLTTLATAQLPLAGVGGLLAVGVVALAAACHWAVIFGGASAMDALARLVFKPRLWWLGRRIRREERAAQTAQDAARDAIRSYDGELRGYREEHGEPPHHLLIQVRDADLINTAVDEPVVAAPAGEPRDPRLVPPQLDDPPAEDAPPPPPAPDRGDIEPSGASSPRAEPAPEEERREDGAAAEAEYLRRVLDARLRDADGEVGP